MTPEQFNRLPLYARRHIDILEGRVSHLEEQLRGAEDPHSNTQADLYPVFRPLPNGSRITFRVNGEVISAQVVTYGKTESLELMGRGLSSGLTVRPRSGNVVLVESEGF